MNVKTLSLRSLQVHLKVAIVALCMAAALFVMPHPAQAAQLNEAQIQAIVGLLQSFDVDPATVNHVNSILRGTNTSGSSRHGTFSVSAPAAERSFSPGDTLAINWNDTTATAATRYHIVLWPHTYPNGSGWPLAGSGYGLSDATSLGFSWIVDSRPSVGPYIVRICRIGEDVCGVSRTIHIVAQTVNTNTTATTQVNGACGSANGTTVSSAPASNLCSVGTASGVVGNVPWNWVCTSSSGTTASCVATKTATTQVNGACGSANGTTVSSAPASNLCSVGTASGVVGTGPWNWVCTSSSGTTASCVAAKAEVAAPTATLTTNGALTNAIIESNGTIINAWSSTGADQWSSTIAMSGCYNTNLNTGTKSWTANTASGNGGTWSASPYAGCITTITYTAKNSATGKSATATMTNHVSPPSASVDLKVTTPTQSSSDGSATAPATVVLGQSLIWSWTAQNVSSCTLSWTGATSGSLSEPTTGSLTTSPSPAGSYVMKMTCLVPTGGSVSDSVNLVVTSGSQANTPSFNFLSAYSEAFNQNMAAVAVGIVDIPLSILTDALSDLFYYAGIY